MAYEYYEPEPDTKLVAVQVVIGNESNPYPLQVNPLSATLVDSDGFNYQPSLSSLDIEIVMAILQPGEKVRGWVGFTVPVNAKPASIKWYPRPYDPDGKLQTGLSQ